MCIHVAGEIKGLSRVVLSVLDFCLTNLELCPKIAYGSMTRITPILQMRK